MTNLWRRRASRPRRPGPRTFGWIGWGSVGVFVVCIFIVMPALAFFSRPAPAPNADTVRLDPTSFAGSNPFVDPVGKDQQVAPVGNGGEFSGSTAGLYPRSATPPSSIGATPPSYLPACMLYDDNLDVEPGNIISMRANVLPGACDSREELAAEKDLKTVSPGKTSKQDVHVSSGAKIKASLSASLYDASVDATADHVQTFDGGPIQCQWAWKLRPNSSGDLALPLTLTIYDAAGQNVAHEAANVNVSIHAPVTTSYIISSTWTGLIGFFASLQGLVTSIAGAAAGTAGFRVWAVRKTKKQDAPAPAPAPAPVPVGATTGYL